MIKGKFLKIKCRECNNIQIIFGKSSTKVRCERCKFPLIKPSGGKAKIRALIKKII